MSTILWFFSGYWHTLGDDGSSTVSCVSLAVMTLSDKRRVDEVASWACAVSKVNQVVVGSTGCTASCWERERRCFVQRTQHDRWTRHVAWTTQGSTTFHVLCFIVFLLNPLMPTVATVGHVVECWTCDHEVAVAAVLVTVQPCDMCVFR